MSCAIWWRTYSCSPGGNNVVTVSGSRVRMNTTCFPFRPRLYFRPLFRISSSSLVHVKSVLLTTLG